MWPDLEQQQEQHLKKANKSTKRIIRKYNTRERERGSVRTTDLFYDGVGGADEESVGDDVMALAVLKLYGHRTEPAHEVVKLLKSEELSGLVDTVVIVGKVAVPDDQPSKATRTCTTRRQQMTGTPDAPLSSSTFNLSEVWSISKGGI
ncbi:hypothetical protein LWI28_002525 [Acer negundo]|uniref:Uncharacterized protein n=1 Tax=Acer negundo TaxID=4023 RepID=A0AAD5NGU4_ACENE|nr:hypothetical protein LWI28_002525 [Acer negundo]